MKSFPINFLTQSVRTHSYLSPRMAAKRKWTIPLFSNPKISMQPFLLADSKKR